MYKERTQSSPSWGTYLKYGAPMLLAGVIVAGARGGSVLVVAAPTESRDLYSPVPEQAVDSYLAG